MASRALKKAVTKPTAKKGRSLMLRWSRDMNRSKPVARNMVGMARKKENSVAALRDNPVNRPPMMVAPEREVPGMSENTWATPSLSASRQSMSSTSVMRGSRCRRSTRKMTRPPTMSASATTTGLNRCALISPCSSRPHRAEGSTAMTRLVTKRRERSSLPRVATTRLRRSR